MKDNFYQERYYILPSNSLISDFFINLNAILQGHGPGNNTSISGPLIPFPREDLLHIDYAAKIPGVLEIEISRRTPNIEADLYLRSFIDVIIIGLDNYLSDEVNATSLQNSHQ